MAEVNAKDLTTKTTPASTDSMLLFGTTSNEGAKITVDNLADNILSRLSTKTFANQVGGSSAATLLSQLSTLNSNINKKAGTPNIITTVSTSTFTEFLATIGQAVHDTMTVGMPTVGGYLWSSHNYYTVIGLRTGSSTTRLMAYVGSTIYTAEHNASTSTTTIYRYIGTAWTES